MLIFKNSEYELEYKYLYKDGDMFMCDADANEFGDIENETCWRLPNIEEGGLR